METRARRASRCHNSAYSLPQELWTVVLSFLSPKEAAQAASVCSDFRKVAQQAVQLAIQRLWPHHSHRLAGKVIALGVQRTLALVQAHESEAAAHPDLSKVAQLQKLVLPEHRQIAVEWLIEVSICINQRNLWSCWQQHLALTVECNRHAQFAMMAC
jgi:hypothetical protein